MSKDDLVIDLGPEGGDKPVLSEVEGGGEIVAEGTPEQVAREPRSYTGLLPRPAAQRAGGGGGGSPDGEEAEDGCSKGA